MRVYLWQLSVIGFHEQTLISGTLLSGRWPIRSATKTIVGNFIQIMRSYFHKTYSHRDVKIRMENDEWTLTTTGKGHFYAIVERPASGDIDVEVRGRTLEIPQDYPYMFMDSDADTEVVSDLDDTVMVSHTASALKRISTILFYRPKKRKAVAYTHDLFRRFGKHNYRIMYLSKSESNLFGLINSVIRFRELPEGPLLLTPFLNIRQLFNPKKGEDYKLNNLRLIIEHLPGKKFILLGDDTQRDMDVYSQISKEYPDRIRKIYIRQTTLKPNRKQIEKWNALQATGADAIYFKDTDEIGEEVINKPIETE